MPKFKYSATDASGIERKGTIDAESQDRAIQALRAEGMFLSEVRPIYSKQKKSLSLPSLNFTIGAQRIGKKELTLITRQLAILLNAGLPLIKAIRTLSRQAKNPNAKSVLESIASYIESGHSFSESLTQHPKTFSKLYVNMVKAGEASSAMDKILERLASFMEKAAKVKAKVTAAMVYPAIVMTIASIITIGLIVFIVPRFEKIFEDMLGNKPLPILTQKIMALSKIFSDPVQGISILVIIVVIIAGLIYASKNAKSSYYLDTFKLKIPLIGPIIAKTSITRFSRTLGTLLGSGVAVLQALNIVKETSGNAAVSRAISTLHDAVKEGEGISNPLKQTNIFPEMVVSMIEVGEETGKLPEMLDKIAETYDDEIDNAVTALTSMIEPIMIVLLAVIVGTIVIALFMPLLTIMQSMGN